MLQTLLGSDGSCSNNWHYYSGTSSCFYPKSNQNSKRSFTEARTWCKNNGAELASITDQAERNFVEGIVS